VKTLPGILSTLLAALLSSCAIGPSKIAVAHSALQPVPTKHSGTIAVREFTDSRKDCASTQLGNKRNGFGMVLGSYHIKGDKSISAVLTEHFADALRAAGYQVTVTKRGSSPSSANAFLEGDIQEFWLDLYMAVWDNIGIKIKLMDGSGQRTLWEKKIEANQTNVLMLGANSEIEKVIRQAMDKALNQAAKEFASESFASKVRS
jgi:hypothetical protein